jgi:hypothetical protein
MSAPSHDHFTETKPVSFTVPFILAAVTLLVIGLFLSLCDPSSKHHDKHDAAASHGQHDMHATDKDAHGPGHTDTPPAHAEEPAEGAQHH